MHRRSAQQALRLPARPEHMLPEQQAHTPPVRRQLEPQLGQRALTLLARPDHTLPARLARMLRVRAVRTLRV
ncbi:hypothetical protein ACQPYH_16120 [Kribbella sp. CA-245084]|uniref:hypothetical protein n=1 Tax=Kribbella sp. CA-245084 TaxID=3239940 RepID=UPI003D91BC42